MFNINYGASFGDLSEGASPKNCVKNYFKLDAKQTSISTAVHSIYTGQAQAGLHNLPHAMCPLIIVPDCDS